MFEQIFKTIIRIKFYIPKKSDAYWSSFGIVSSFTISVETIKGKERGKIATWAQIFRRLNESDFHVLFSRAHLGNNKYVNCKAYKAFSHLLILDEKIHFDR